MHRKCVNKIFGAEKFTTRNRTLMTLSSTSKRSRTLQFIKKLNRYWNDCWSDTHLGYFAEPTHIGFDWQIHHSYKHWLEHVQKIIPCNLSCTDNSFFWRLASFWCVKYIEGNNYIDKLKLQQKYTHQWNNQCSSPIIKWHASVFALEGSQFFYNGESNTVADFYKYSTIILWGTYHTKCPQRKFVINFPHKREQIRVPPKHKCFKRYFCRNNKNKLCTALRRTGHRKAKLNQLVI